MWHAKVVPAAVASVTQARVHAALRRLGYAARLEARAARGAFSVDIALEARGARVAVEVCGPWHFNVPAAALGGGGGSAGGSSSGNALGRVRSSPDVPFSEALVVAAAATAAGGLAAGRGGLKSPDAFFVVPLVGNGKDAGSGGKGGAAAGQLLLLDGATALRARLLEAHGWRVVHLPFHIWIAAGGSDGVLVAMLDAALAGGGAGRPAGCGGDGDDEGEDSVAAGVTSEGAEPRASQRRNGRQRQQSYQQQRPIDAASAAKRVHRAARNAVERRREARQLRGGAGLQQRGGNGSGSGSDGRSSGADTISGFSTPAHIDSPMAELAWLVASYAKHSRSRQRGGGGDSSSGSGGDDDDDLHLDIDDLLY